MAYFYLYRKNGGQVIAIATATTWTPDDYFGEYEDEAQKDLATPQWSDGNEIRNATAPEIANFPTAVAEDTVDMEQAHADDIVDGDSSCKCGAMRTTRALMEVVVDELNILRDLHSLADRTIEELIASMKTKIAAEE